jgi:hypothetical protein
MWDAVRPGGVLAVEDADLDGMFCDPDNAGMRQLKIEQGAARPLTDRISVAVDTPAPRGRLTLQWLHRQPDHDLSHPGSAFQDPLTCPTTLCNRLAYASLSLAVIARICRK